LLNNSISIRIALTTTKSVSNHSSTSNCTDLELNLDSTHSVTQLLSIKSHLLQVFINMLSPRSCLHGSIKPTQTMIQKCKKWEWVIICQMLIRKTIPKNTTEPYLIFISSN